MSPHGLVLRGGTVIDGSGSPPFRADVRVSDSRIVEIGPDLASHGEEVLDAAGAFVTPGFIDVHTHLDPVLFWDPLVDPLPQHGVTSVVIGNCSLSLAPLPVAQRAPLSDVFSFIEDFPPEVFREHVPWSWTGFGEYLDAVDSGSSVHVSALVGHTPIRLSVLGDDAWTRAATHEEIELMGALLDEALRGGAIGLSTSFFDADERGRPVPPIWADDRELEHLADVLETHDGLLEFVPNLSGDYEADIERVARLVEPRGLAATWTGGVGYMPREPQMHRRRLAAVQRLRDGGARLYPQISPRSFDIRINWMRSISFGALVHTWHQAIAADRAAKFVMLADPVWRESARAEWDAVRNSIFPVHQLERVRLVSVTDPSLERWVGRTFAEVVAERGGHPSDVLADWVLENDLAPGVVCIGVSNDDPLEVAHILTHAATIIGSSDAGAHAGMMCADGDTTLLLTRFVRERGDLAIEAAVHALTGQLASFLGWSDRGTVAVGSAADLVVFALDELTWQPDSFVEHVPGVRRLRRPPGGFRWTIADGVVTQRHGELTGAKPGRVLTRAGTHRAG